MDFEISKLLRDIEKSCGHDRTIVAGDLNSEPYYDGMTSAAGMHALMSKSLVRQGQREISPFGPSSFFYNPMWSIYGDESDGPPGTYYRQSSEELCQFWHVFDQVLIRPSLVPLLPKKSVSVAIRAGSLELLNPNGTPSVSDHLPIIFDFGLPQLTFKQ